MQQSGDESFGLKKEVTSVILDLHRDKGFKNNIVLVVCIDRSYLKKIAKYVFMLLGSQNNLTNTWYDDGVKVRIVSLRFGRDCLNKGSNRFFDLDSRIGFSLLLSCFLGRVIIIGKFNERTRSSGSHYKSDRAVKKKQVKVLLVLVWFFFGSFFSLKKKKKTQKKKKKDRTRMVNKVKDTVTRWEEIRVVKY